MEGGGWKKWRRVRRVQEMEEGGVGERMEEGGRNGEG